MSGDLTARVAALETQLKIAKDDYNESLDTIWMLLASMLVFFMHSGFSLLESGTVRFKNTQNILAKNLLVVTVGFLCWYVLGYALAIGVTSSPNKFMGTANFFMDGFGKAKESYRVWFFQGAFCATAATIVSGAFVAGNDAGRAYNTFPKMGDEWVPSGIADLTPWYRNLKENTATVQFNHRVLGISTAVGALGLAGIGLLSPMKAKSAALFTSQVRMGLCGVGLTALGQMLLGITTLLYYVPLSLAAAHQVGSIAVFSSGVYLTHSLRYARPALSRLSGNVMKKGVTKAAS